MEKILILMATYNGEKYILEQLKSLSKQSYKNFEVLISDDFSKDKTLKIIEDYIRLDERFHLFKQDKNLRALKNFEFLINEAKKKKEFEYIMFCDQDDIWLEDKIKISLDEIKKYTKTATLVYSKKKFVDGKLEELNIKQKFFKEETELRFLLHQNAVYGCTSIINRKLLNVLENKIPNEFINHDHYIALIARLYGEIHFLNKETILYRQHGNNVSGDNTTSLLKKVLKKPDLRRNIKLFFFIIDYILLNHSLKLNKKDKILLENLKNKINNNSKISLIILMIRNKIFKLTFKGTLNFYFEILRGEIDESSM